MPVADFLEKVAGGLEDGAKTVGRVAETALPAVGKAVVNEEAGYAPQIAAEGRQHQQAMDDAAIGAKAKVLESQLGQLQSNAPLFNSDGTPMSPQQRSAALSGLTDQYTQLYSHPRHAPQLMEALRKAVHPNGAVAGPVGAGNPAKAMGGFTTAAPPGYDDQQAQAQKEKEFQAQLAFFDKTIAPHLNPTQVAQKRNEFIDHLAGIKEPGAEKPPKGLKAMEQGGVFFGVEDQDTGKQYLKQQLEAGGDAPPEAKQMYKTVQEAAKAKHDEEESREDHRAQLARESQTRSAAIAQDRTDRTLRNAIAEKDYATAQKEVTKVKDAYDGSLDRLSTMDQSYKNAVKGDQQAMTNLLANHIAMTKQQLGTANRSPTRADFEEAANSLPYGDKLYKQYVEHGVLSGLTLSKEQMDQMMELAHEKVTTLKEHLDRTKDDYEDALNPADSRGKPVKKGGVASQLKPPSSAPSGPPAGATHIKKYQGKEYWVDSQGNNLGEKK